MKTKSGVVGKGLTHILDVDYHETASPTPITVLTEMIVYLLKETCPTFVQAALHCYVQCQSNTVTVIMSFLNATCLAFLQAAMHCCV